jgi:hypothetical protein
LLLNGYLVAITIQLAASVTLSCTSELVSEERELDYGCTVDHIVCNSQDHQIVSVKNTNHNYRDFNIEKSPDCHVFPTGITKFLKSLQYLAIEETNITKLTSEDLKEFEDLRGLTIDNCKITTITRDLFKYCTKLEQLSLQDNPIKHIEAGALKQLKLQELDFYGNQCSHYDYRMVLEREVAATIEKIEKACGVGDDSKDRSKHEQKVEHEYKSGRFAKIS